jgi:hypothetical protein
VTVWLGGHLTQRVFFDKVPTVARITRNRSGNAIKEATTWRRSSAWIRTKRVLSAVALDDRGGVLGIWNGAMSARSITALLGWAAELTPAVTSAIEGNNNLGVAAGTRSDQRRRGRARRVPDKDCGSMTPAARPR